MLFRAIPLLLLTALLGCSNADPVPEGGGAADVADAAGVEHTDHEKVRECFTTERQELLFEADSLELFAIVCEREADPGEATLGEEGYPIRTRVELSTAQQRAEVLGALYAGVAEGGDPAECFEPHHALRAKNGDDELLVVICYLCTYLQVWENGERVDGIEIGLRGMEVLNRALGQEQSVPADEVHGRPLTYWVEQFHAGLEVEDPDARGEGFELALSAFTSLLASRDTPPEVHGTVTRCFMDLYPFDSELVVGEVIQILDQAEFVAGRQAAVELSGALGDQSIEDEADRERLIQVANTLFEVLCEPAAPPPEEPGTRGSSPKPQSPELRSAVKQALLAYRWVPAEVLQEWHRLAESEDELPELREELLATLATLKKE